MLLDNAVRPPCILHTQQCKFPRLLKQFSVFRPDLLGQLMYQLGESYERLLLHSGGGDAVAGCERRIACEAAAAAANDVGRGRPHPDAARVRSLLR